MRSDRTGLVAVRRLTLCGTLSCMSASDHLSPEQFKPISRGFGVTAHGAHDQMLTQLPDTSADYAHVAYFPKAGEAIGYIGNGPHPAYTLNDDDKYEAADVSHYRLHHVQDGGWFKEQDEIWKPGADRAV